MSNTHRSVAGLTPAHTTSHSHDTAAPARVLRATPPVPKRTLKASGLTRRYAMSWLGAGGFIEDETRIAPAIPLFEEGFSALARGAVLVGEAGPIAIEDLLPGMRVHTAEERIETVTWIGTMTMFPTNADQGAKMIRVTADAFGQGRPMPDLVLGPYARICLRDARLRGRLGIEQAYVPISGFVDGVSVIEVQPVSPVSVYHVVLERQGSLRIAGLEVESYHPGEGAERLMEPRMAQLFADIFPQVERLSDFGRMAHPRLTKFEIEDMLG